MGGFGTAVLEAACAHGWDTRVLRTLGIPDQFIEHGDRNELLSQHNVDLYLSLEMRGVGLLAFDQVKSVADQGYESAMPRIEAWLNHPPLP